MQGVGFCAILPQDRFGPLLARHPRNSAGRGSDVGEVRILLLRGVNVSGAHRLPMAAFRAMLGEIGLSRVATHIQSGNAVFHDPGLAGLEGRIDVALQARFGFSVALFVMGLEEYRAVMAANPFRVAGAADGAKVHVVFLAGPASGVDLAGLRDLARDSEEIALTDRALYLFTPGGYGRSMVAEKLSRYVKVPQTARNQRSAAAILALAEGV